MSKRCELCGNQYCREEWEICPFCHGRVDWKVFKVDRIEWKGDPHIEKTYHLFSERTFVGIYINGGAAEWWIPVTGTAFKYQRNKRVKREHPVFYARNAVRRAKMNDSFIKDERFV